MIGELIESVVVSVPELLFRRWRLCLCLIVAALSISAVHLLVSERLLFWFIAIVLSLAGLLCGVFWDVRHIDKDFPHT